MIMINYFISGLVAHLVGKHQNRKVWGKAKFTECPALKDSRYEVTMPRKQYQQVVITHDIGQYPRHIVAHRSLEPDVPLLAQVILKDASEAPEDFVTDRCPLFTDMQYRQYWSVP